MIEFYGAYREACDKLLTESRMPRIELDSCALAPEEMRRLVENALTDWFAPAPEPPREP